MSRQLVNAPRNFGFYGRFFVRRGSLVFVSPLGRRKCLQSRLVQGQLDMCGWDSWESRSGCYNAFGIYRQKATIFSTIWKLLAYSQKIAQSETPYSNRPAYSYSVA